MVVEHTFVTTMEAQEALREAASFLQGFGFIAEAEKAFQLGGEWNALEMRRGKTNPARSRPIRDWPQYVRVEWDRGRVDVATSITPPPNSRWDTSSGKMKAKDTAAVQELLVGIAQSIELLLASRAVPAEAGAALARIDAQLEDSARRQRRRSRILLIVVISFAAVAIGLLVFAIVASVKR